MVLILIFAAWARPAEKSGCGGDLPIKWWIVIPLLGVLGLMLWQWFARDQIQEWLDETWTFTELIMPLLFAGVLAAGFLLGMPGTDNGIIPNEWVGRLVGGNSLLANFGASLIGALMYFATLTEIPILEGCSAAAWARALRWRCCWPDRAVAAQYAGDPQRPWNKEDAHVHRHCGGPVHHSWCDFRRNCIDAESQTEALRMKVQILGTGCPKCKKLSANAEEAIANSGVAAEIEKIDRLPEIMAFGVMSTPALAIDGDEVRGQDPVG